METLCFTTAPTPLRCTPKLHSTLIPVNDPITKHKTKNKLKNKLSITATLTNPFVQFSCKPSVLPSPLQMTPSDIYPSLNISQAPLMEVSADSLRYESGFLGAVPQKPVVRGGEVGDGMRYLTKILSAKVYDVAVESPLHYASKLSERVGVNIWLKREDLQPVYSFKLRGAYNMMAKLSTGQLAKGVICSSAGNHAQGVALSAQKLGCNALIVMPVTTPEIKWKKVESLGAEVVLAGETYDEAQAYAKQRAKDEGRTFVPPFDHPEVIAGQGTVGMEILRQMPDSLHAIFVPVGGGGLIAGVAAYVKRVCPEVKIIGVEPYDANAMALSLHHGQRIMLQQVGGFADGVAVKVVGVEPFRLCRELIDGIVLVSRDAICASIKDMFEEKRSILEPAGALAMAGAEAYCKYYGLKGANVVAIASGANMNFDRLRLVSQLADVGRRREAVLATFVPEKWGTFKQFYEQVAPVNISEFRYRYDVHKKEALIIYSVRFHSSLELEEMLGKMESAHLKTLNLTDNELVKDHIQFMVGGRSKVDNEILCQFEFPEKPGTMGKFLDAFSPRWNISLVHYRAQCESVANVLVGFQVAANEMEEFTAVADRLGCDYAFETQNEALQTLLH